MNKFSVGIPCVGELKMEEAFYIMGPTPILFVCKDGTEQRYLVSCCRLGEQWVVCKVSDSMLLRLTRDEVTIRAVFENSDATYFVSWDGEKYECTSSASDKLFPKAGEFLELDEEEIGAYRDKLKSIVQQKKMHETFANVAEMMQPIANYVETFQLSVRALQNVLAQLNMYNQVYQEIGEKLNKSYQTIAPIFAAAKEQASQTISFDTVDIKNEAAEEMKQNVSKPAPQTETPQDYQSFDFDCYAA